MSRLSEIKDDRQLLGLVVIVLVVVLLCAKVIHTRQESRPTIQGKEIIEAEIRGLQNDINDLRRSPAVGPVDTYWLGVFAQAERHGVEVSPSDGAAVTKYTGPLKSRTGTITGRADSVLAFLYSLEQSMPFYIYAVNIEAEDKASVVISVVGV